MTTSNAFTMVRPKGASTASSPRPKKVVRGRPPPSLGDDPMALDRNGRPTVRLEPKKTRMHLPGSDTQ